MVVWGARDLSNKLLFHLVNLLINTGGSTGCLGLNCNSTKGVHGDWVSH